MGYSIFSDTMADMTFLQIEQAAQEKQVVLFPIAVIEEHGPHLPLGTDVYLTYQFAKGDDSAPTKVANEEPRFQVGGLGKPSGG